MSDESRSSELHSAWLTQRASLAFDPTRSRQVVLILTMPMNNEMVPAPMRFPNTQSQMHPTSSFDYHQPMQQQLQVKQDAWSPSTQAKENIPSRTEKQSSGKPITSKLVLGVMIGLVVCGIPLAVMTTMYIEQKASSNGSSSSSSGSSSNGSSVSLPSQCTTYTTNTDQTRNVAYTSCCYCDTSLSTGWYRFSGAAGTSLITSAVSTYLCGSVNTGWFNGTLPSTAGTTSSGTVCFNFNGNLCTSPYAINSVSATNCSGFYVFYLTTLSYCNFRYCTS